MYELPPPSAPVKENEAPFLRVVEADTAHPGLGPDADCMSDTLPYGAGRGFGMNAGVAAPSFTTLKAGMAVPHPKLTVPFEPGAIVAGAPISVAQFWVRTGLVAGIAGKLCVNKLRP